MDPLYSYDRRRVAKELNLAHWHLEGLTQGRPVVLYHGTTKLFRKFDMNMSRDELVNNYYGRGIFLTPSKRVAEKYAEANRNIGFDPSIIDDLKRKNPNAGNFLQILYNHGADGWEKYMGENGFLSPNGGLDLESFRKHLGGVDPNKIDDIAGYILGSKVKPLGAGGDALTEVMNVFHNAPTGAPDWIYEYLDELGLNSKVYRPKVYTVTVTVSNPLITANKTQARKARTKGYDSVIFYGSDLVDGVPEVAVFDPRAVRIKKIEIVD